MALTPRDLARRLRVTEAMLLLPPILLALVGMITVIVVPVGAFSWAWADLQTTLLFIGLLLLVHVWLFAVLPGADQVLLPLVGALAALGLIMTQRLEPSLVSLGPAFRGIAGKQVAWIAIGVLALLATVAALRDVRWLARYKYTWAVAGVALATATMVLGVERGGSTGWFDLGIFYFQPSEVLKIILAIFLAAYLAEKRDLLAARRGWLGLPLPPLQYLAPLLTVFGLSMLVLVVQREIGSALLFFGIFLAVLYVASGSKFYVLSGTVLFAAGSYLTVSLFSHVRTRVDIWLDPWATGHGSGYQIVQSLFALASGGVLGSGLGRGQPTYIPAVHTDFVFAAMGEEIGLVGVLGVLALYLTLVFRGLHIALRAQPGFPQLLAAGLSTILGLQTVIIVAGVTKLLPLTGITLPFISYGGSSLVTNFVIVGLLLRISAGSGRSVSLGKAGP